MNRSAGHRPGKFRSSFQPPRRCSALPLRSSWVQCAKNLRGILSPGEKAGRASVKPSNSSAFCNPEAPPPISVGWKSLWRTPLAKRQSVARPSNSEYKALAKIILSFAFCSLSWYGNALLYYRFFDKGLGGVRRRCVMRQIGGRVVILGQRSVVRSP
jgi:hypothetical protein